MAVAALSAIVRKASQEMPAGSAIDDFSDWSDPNPPAELETVVVGASKNRHSKMSPVGGRALPRGQTRRV